MAWTASTYERGLLPLATDPNGPEARPASDGAWRVAVSLAGRLRIARAVAIGNAVILGTLAAFSWPLLINPGPDGQVPAPLILVFLMGGLLASCLAAGVLSLAPSLPDTRSSLPSRPDAGAGEASLRGAVLPLPLGDLVDRMRHDLRTPLNAVIGFSDIMQQELLGPLGTERYHGYASHIRDSGLAVLKAAEDTLELTRLLAELASQREPVPVAVSALIASAIASLPAELQARVELHQAAPPRFVLGEPLGLRHALVHLLAAAASRAGSGSPVCVALERAPSDVRIMMSTGPWSDEPADGPPRVPATGLPIEIATGLIELQGGSVVVSVEEGSVWVAHVRLPAARD
jgi:signal transduction histidine kinase